MITILSIATINISQNFRGVWPPVTDNADFLEFSEADVDHPFDP